MVAAVNPNWPTLFAEGQFGSNPYYGVLTGAAYADMTGRLYKTWSVRRGKQFELDQVQPGEFHGQWVNTDGALDPSNATSPYAPVPYRGYRLRLQYPPSQNLLGSDQATGGEGTPLAAGTSGNGYGVFGSYGSYAVTASGSAYQGTQVWQFTGTTGSTGSSLLFTSNVPTVSKVGTSYTFSVRVRSVTTGKNPTVTPVVVWVSPSGNPVSQVSGSAVALTGSPSAAWTTITITATVPGPFAGLYPVATQLNLQLTAAPTGTWSFQADGLQVEAAGAATAFSAPGTPYSLYSGLIERYPQSWDYTGTYGIVSTVCVDTMALLSQTILKEAFTQDIIPTSPQWFFPLNDPSGAVTFAEQAGRTPSAGLFVSGYGAGAASAGTGVTSAAPSGKFLGTAGPVVNFNNPTVNQGTLIDLGPAGIAGPPSSGDWTRMFAIRTTQTGATVWAATSGSYPTFTPGVFFSVQNITGLIQVSVNGNSASVGATNGFVACNDGNWHLVWVDDLDTTASIGGDAHTSGIVNDALGGEMYATSGQVGGFAYVGDMAHVAQWNFALDSTTINTLYTSWRTAWQGDSTDARYARILGYAGYRGPESLDAGTTTALQPAIDISSLDALTALQNVVNTEAGRHFVASNGAVTFQSRQRGFQAVTPVWTFGENQGSGEIPYTDLAFDFDPTRISNSITVTQVDTNQVFSASDVTSQQAYGTRSFSRSNQALSTEECRSSAYFYLSRYKDPQMRVSALKVDVASNPALWPSVLQFELGQRVLVNRRPPFGQPMISTGGFIEQITHTANDQGAWQVELQISPSTATPYASFTDLHTTLHANATAGNTSVSINALPDAATNVLRANLTGGQFLLLGVFGPQQELVQVATGGVPVTSTGYQQQPFQW